MTASSIFWSVTVSQSFLINYFVIPSISFSGDPSDVILWVRMGSEFGGRTTEVMCPSRHIIARGQLHCQCDWSLLILPLVFYVGSIGQLFPLLDLLPHLSL